MREKLHLFQPKPFDEVDAKFTISGSVPRSWLKTEFKSEDNRLFLDLIDIRGKVFMGTALPVEPNWLSKLIGRVFFGVTFQFHELNISALQRSQGRILLQFNGHKQYEQELFLPIVVREFIPKTGPDLNIVNQHKHLIQKILQYREDIKNYYQGLEKIRESRKAKGGGTEYRHLYEPMHMSIATGIFKILDEANDEFSEYAYSEEDRQENELKEKYKDAIEWRGPLARGLVSQFGEFELRVHSDDHDQHFHVIHKGKHVDARFSFPDFRLVNYKTRQNTISSKEEKRIQEFCKRPEIFKLFEEEFKKRNQ